MGVNTRRNNQVFSMKSVQFVFDEPAVEWAVLQRLFPGRAKPDLLDQLTVAEVDVRRGTLAALFEKIAECLHE